MLSGPAPPSSFPMCLLSPLLMLSKTLSTPPALRTHHRGHALGEGEGEEPHSPSSVFSLTAWGSPRDLPGRQLEKHTPNPSLLLIPTIPSPSALSPILQLGCLTCKAQREGGRALHSKWYMVLTEHMGRLAWSLGEGVRRGRGGLLHPPTPQSHL